MKKWGIIGYACGAGAGNDGCKLGPSALKENKIEQALKDQHVDASWLTVYKSNLPAPISPEEKLHFILDYCKNISSQTHDLVSQAKMPLVFGGDHSMAIGTWSGVTSSLDAYEELGLMWIDAHMDAHTPSSSGTGNIHGMPLAVLLGFGHPQLVGLEQAKNKLSAKHVVMIGIRSYEEGEHALLTSLGVKIYYMDEIKERGFKAVYKEALEIVTQAKKGFGITFDVDAFDAELVPGTGTKETNGLRRREVFPEMQGVAYHPLLKAIEIAEFNPQLDEKGRTFALIREMLECFFYKTAN